MPTKKAIKKTAKRPAKKAARKPTKKRTTRSEFTRIMAGLEKGKQPIGKQRPSKYFVEASFVSDRALSREEIAALETQLITVIAEPNDEWATGVGPDHMTFETTECGVVVRASRRRMS